MINKRVIMVLMALMILIIGVTAVSAEDSSNNNLTSAESTVSTADTINNADITSDVSNKESLEPKTSNQVKSSKLTAGESSKYNITQDTYSNYFNDSGYLSDDVNDGDTLDIQGLINITDGRMVINKAVNIVSTTENGTIAFNTPYGAPDYKFYGDNLPKVAFIINNQGSYTNVTGISFINTQIWSTNNTHVT
ncbi:MAG: hypothetical protein E7Z84_05370, partial [Methanosphaera stadtmanae]|nr:hypothetical protein [Methanosphaera stadtmanae]